MIRRAIYPGSFDPVTNGHLDLIERCARLFDEVIVAVLMNGSKHPFFTAEERVGLLREVVPVSNVQVESFDGLLVEYAKERGASVIIRGIRAIADYEYELQMALMNRRLNPGIETIFLLPAEPYSYLSSRLVKEVFSLGGSMAGLVHPLVEERMRAKVAVTPSPRSKQED
ncbi:MAG: pantetheine-phosphate adenylyltransferase [Acidobacteria bacterium]|nr:pantetheine-phosphate adenylyltransferase [Acidobacteriota bacterium]